MLLGILCDITILNNKCAEIYDFPLGMHVIQSSEIRVICVWEDNVNCRHCVGVMVKTIIPYLVAKLYG